VGFRVGQVEHQPNVFAANFLMPLDDFRRQIPASAKIDLENDPGLCRALQSSLIAVTLRWPSYTEKRAVLVVARDGFILWARSASLR
jgi:Zn-dependent peptidase ImmA (M78 family)